MVRDADDPVLEPETSAEEPRRNKRKGRRKKRKRPAAATGFFSGFGALLAANTPFLLTRVLLPLVLIAVVGGTIGYLTFRHGRAKQLDQLAERLFGDVAGGTADPLSPPYVRGQLAIVETQIDVRPEHQDTGKPLYWINDYVEPPVNAPETIGSVILIEWKMFATAARDSSGRAMGVQGDSDGDPVMLKKWRCTLKLLDRKRRVVLYQANLEPPERTFHEGEKILTTPSTSVTPKQLAVEFDKVLAFPQIGLDDNPPTRPAPAPPAPGGKANGPTPPARPGR